jgi:pimeloyl-ACP methyl ester carboxylesterase
MYVKMARAWAARGYRSLRFDLAGIGDSRLAAGYSKTRLYSKGSTVDVQTAMDALGAFGCDRFILVGLCSGAYVAFQTARTDERVAGQILMNPRRLAWREGDTLESVMTQSYKSTHFYRKALLAPRTYFRLLRGEIDVRGISKRVGSLALARLSRAGERLRTGRPTEEEVLANVRQLCNRGTSLLLIVGAEDDGLDYLEFHLGPRGKRLHGNRRHRSHLLARGQSGVRHRNGVGASGYEVRRLAVTSDGAPITGWRRTCLASRRRSQAPRGIRKPKTPGWQSTRGR